MLTYARRGETPHGGFARNPIKDRKSNRLCRSICLLGAGIKAKDWINNRSEKQSER
jgi:hypothetical protein